MNINLAQKQNQIVQPKIGKVDLEYLIQKIGGLLQVNWKNKKNFGKIQI